MPLLVHAVVAWLIGLYAATLYPMRERLSLPIWIAAGAVLILLLARTKPLRIVCVWCALSLSAFLVGVAHAHHQSTCINALSDTSATLMVAVDSRVSDGAFVRGEARGVDALRGCTLNVTVKASFGEAPPGNIAHFTGTRTVTDRGLKLEGEIRAGSQTDVLRAWRGRAGETLDTLFGPRAALARALLIADQAGIDPAIRDRFAAAGLVHILSISGLHVALIASALTVIAGALRLPNTVGVFGSLFLVLLYVLALGAPPPAVRSAVMLATGTLIGQIQRPVHPWTALALGAVIPTWRPDVVLDVGWQLSVAGMASLVAARAVMRRMRNATPPLPTRGTTGVTRTYMRAKRRTALWVQRLEGWRWTIVRELITGTIASTVTAPIVAWYFGRVSLVAPLSNIAAGPVIAFLQPTLFLALVVAPWRSVAKLAADACTVPLIALNAIAEGASKIPYASVHVAPSLLSAVCLGVATAALVRASAARWPARMLMVCVCALCVAVWSPAFHTGSGDLELHMIDVGQGDAIALRTPHGHWILIDAGRSWSGGDAGRRTVVPYLRRRGGDVAAFVLSHPHDDHVGGAASVIVALHPEQWWEPAYVGTSPTYRSALLELQSEHIPWHRAHPADSVRIDGVLLRMLAPDSTWTAAQTDPNLASVVVLVEFGHVRWLFTGDAEVEEEQWLVTRWGHALSASILKAGHHGSKTSSSAAFLDQVNPSVALISVGADNTYGHPSASTLQEFAKRGIKAFRTDRDGSVVVRTDGTRQEVETSAGKWTVPE